MSSNNNQINVPQAKEAMERFKMECANEVGVNLKQGYNGDISAREAGSVGGQMVKKMINLCKQMNYAKYKSEQYEDFKKQLQELVAERSV